MKGDSVKGLFLHIFLIIGVIVVLLPLFWMIITAFKQPGEGMRFNFFPTTQKSTGTFSLDLTQDYENKLILEYVNPTATKVAAAGSFNEWNSEANLMRRFDGVWRIEFIDLPAGKYEYKFVVNENDWLIDPAHENIESGNSVIVVPENGIVANKDLTNATKYKDERIEFKYYAPTVSKVQVNFQGQTIDLIRDDAGYWSAFKEIPAGKYSYNFIFIKSFKEALNDLYTYKNFIRVLINPDFPFAKFFMNSVVVAVGTAILTCILCLLAGYAFAKKQFYFKDKLFLILLGSMMVPGMIFMVPQFAIVNIFGWINSYQGLIVPHLANVFGLFLLTQYLKTIPDSLFEAARIDGANEFQVFRIIVIPLSLPIIVTLFLLTFVTQWTNFLWQLIVNTPDSPFRTLPVGLALFRGQYATEWEIMMAAACFSIIPITVMFLFAQKFFIEGMTQGAVKE
jgi:multiple sugar transport system permease protein